MPLTKGLTSLTAAKGEGHIHSDKWHRCVEHVKAKGGGYDPYAVCTFSIGYNESINEEHQTKGPHSSRDTRRFKRRKERQEAEKMDSYAAILKFDVALVYKEHMCWGHACSGKGVPHGKVSEAHQKELGLPSGKYTNKPGVGIIGGSHEDNRKEPARRASVSADVASNTVARDKKKNASHIEHDQAARAHSAAAKEHEKLGNTKEAAGHHEKAKFHREQSKQRKSMGG